MCNEWARATTPGIHGKVPLVLTVADVNHPLCNRAALLHELSSKIEPAAIILNIAGSLVKISR